MKKIFNTIKSWWMKFAHVLGWINTRILLTITYVILIALPAIFFFIFRIDLIHRKKKNVESHWMKKEPVKHTIEQATHQF